jgi:hypothetical protein
MQSFRPMHLPPLVIGTLLSLGGMIPFWDSPRAIREYGLPERFAVSAPAQACFVISGARISALGMAIWIFYLRGQLAAVDTILGLLAYVGVVDGIVCWQEGVAGRGLFRAFCGVVIGGWGMLGLTAGSV